MGRKGYFATLRAVAITGCKVTFARPWAVTGSRARVQNGHAGSCAGVAAWVASWSYAGITTVFTILSASVCRLASHSGNKKPM
jgi:hypothetical protein